MPEFPPIRFTAALQRRDIAVIALYDNRWRLGGMFFVALWITGAFALIPETSLSWEAALYCLGGVAALVALWFWALVFQQKPPPVTWYEVVEEGLHYSRSAAEKSYAWAFFVRMRETPRLFLLDNGLRAVPLPVFTLTPNEKQRVRALLTRTINAGEANRHHSQTTRPEAHPPAFGPIMPADGPGLPAARPVEEVPCHTYTYTFPTDELTASANAYSPQEKIRLLLIAVLAFGVCFLFFRDHPWRATPERLFKTYAGIFLLPLALQHFFMAHRTKKQYAACPVLQGQSYDELSPSAFYSKTPLSQSRTTWAEMGDAEETEHAFFFTNKSGSSFILKSTLGEKGVDTLRTILDMREKHLSPHNGE